MILSEIFNRVPEIFGDGNQERYFVYAADVVEANILAIDRGDNMAMNIGTGQRTSKNRIFESLKDIIRYRRGVIHSAARLGDGYQISLECAAIWAGHLKLTGKTALPYRRVFPADDAVCQVRPKSRLPEKPTPKTYGGYC